MNAAMPPKPPRREVRLALVLNGGVSLAVWIGGVTKEIDQLRLASEPTGRDDGLGETGRRYRRLMDILDQQARVDVIAGASAGGINGILLSSAIFSGSALPPMLREIWIGLGDFRKLLRSPTDRDPPSLMKGDPVVLAQLRETMGEIYSGWRGRARPKGSVYLYITATDLLGKWRDFQDTTGREFRELDHRRVFEFTYRQGQKDDSGRPATKSLLVDVPMREQPPVYFVDGDAPELLARAGRATASFPVAFEPHGLAFVGERPEDKPDRRWLIDGGLLDNQPFNPVLDRISMLPSELPVRRVVAFVVPYVNEPERILRDVAEKAVKQEEQGSRDPVEPTARRVYAATGSLPRTLPKLQSLERVLREWREQLNAESDRRRLWRVGEQEQQDIRDAAKGLLPAYRRTRYESSRRVFEGWLDESFMPGDGVLAQNPATDPLSTPRFRAATATGEPPADTPWLSESLDWRSDKVWRWGLSPGERVAAWALLFLRDALELADEDLTTAVLEARQSASALVWEIRQRKHELQQRFEAEVDEPDVLVRARRAYELEADNLAGLKESFVELDDRLRRVGASLVPDVRDLLCLEVIRHAWDVEDPRVPFPFEFLFMSAGIGNALGHSFRSPEAKLGGMQAGHFGGFLKRSWRANDWLWGRLDGVQHVIRAAVDLKRVAELGETTWAELADFAFPSEPPEERTELERLWWERVARTSDEEELPLDALGGRTDARASFIGFLAEATALRDGQETEASQRRVLALFRCCQGALAARIQLPVLADDLERVAEAAAEDVEGGSSRIAEGVQWAGRFYGRTPTLRRGRRRPLTIAERVELFRALRIGKEERLEAEAGSRMAIELGAQTVAVGTAMFTGNRGGLPLSVRSVLASARGLTLAVSGLVRLLAASPAIGAGLLAVISALIVWGLVASNALLGALLPALVALAIALGYILLNFATGALEPDINNWKRAFGSVLLVGFPVVMISAGWDGWRDTDLVWEWAHGYVERYIDDWANGVAVSLAVVAFLAAVARLVFELRYFPLRLRHRTLAIYRLGFVGALLAFGVGFAIERWQEEPKPEGVCDPADPCVGTDWASVADERAGLILFASLVAAALLAAILVEILIPTWKRFFEWWRVWWSRRNTRVTG